MNRESNPRGTRKIPAHIDTNTGFNNENRGKITHKRQFVKSNRGGRPQRAITEKPEGEGHPMPVKSQITKFRKEEENSWKVKIDHAGRNVRSQRRGVKRPHQRKMQQQDKMFGDDGWDRDCREPFRLKRKNVGNAR